MAPKDPRRPDAVRKYAAPVYGPDELPPDYRAIIALLAGLMGLVMKSKIASWVALLAAVSSLANLKSGEADYKQIISSVMFAVMGLFTNYIRREPAFA